MRFLLSRGNWRAAAASLADDGKFRREGRDGSAGQRPRTSESSLQLRWFRSGTNLVNAGVQV